MENLTNKKQVNPVSWKVEEYLAYLYLSIADADMQMSEVELKTIKWRLKPLFEQYFPNLNVDIEFLIQNLKRVVETGSEMDRYRIIEELNQKYKLSRELKIEILSDLHDLINVDDVLVFSEYNLMNYIRVCFAEHTHK